MDVASTITDRSPRGIAATFARLAHAGELRPGDRLPTVRDLATELAVSPATVGSAYRALADVGLVASRGRAGTFVLPAPGSRLPPRYRDMAGDAAAHHDLSTGTPDPRLLPPLGPSLAAAVGRTEADDARYGNDPLVPELEPILRATWPFVAQRLTVVDGAIDAMERALGQVTRFGDRVAVEDPAFPPLLDLLDQMGLVRIPVPLDRNGPDPTALERALAAGATAVVIQPRAHNPTGVTIKSTRARALATVLRSAAAPAWVIEDDHSGEISSARCVSLGALVPDRVIHIRSYSKSHGPDLRIAAVGGPAVVLDSLVARRMLGPGWTPRLLQRTLATMLNDGASVDAVSHARRVYHARQRALTGALARHGLVVEPGDGINQWVPVHDEQTALLRLAAVGLRVAPGRAFRSGVVTPGEPGHVRVTVASLRDGVDEVAAAIAAAAAR